MVWQKDFPASSANLGPGFDSIGIAVDRYLTVTARPAERWQVDFATDFMAGLPQDETNLVVAVALETAARYGKTLAPLHLTMKSQIPLTHGMGSSASAIVAGIELANDFADLGLSTFDKVRLASAKEGHPDNVGACITGGLFVGYYEPETDQLFYQVGNLEGVGVIISTPAYELSTAAARSVLPEVYSKPDSIGQNALTSVMLMAMMQGDYPTMGQLMMQDKFHEPYRQSLIAEFPAVKDTALEKGAYATVISGAGPSILTLCPQERVADILAALEDSVDCQHQVVSVLPALADK